MTVSIHARKMSSEELGKLVSSENVSSTLLIDCRPFSAYQESRVLSSINAHVPKLLRRRSKGPLKLENILTCSESREKLRNGLISTIVVYDDRSQDVSNREINDDLISIMECFIQEPQSHLTTEICYLADGYKKFAREYPSLIEFSQPTSLSPPTLFRLQPLQVPCAPLAMTDRPPISTCQAAVSKQRPCLPKLSIQPPECFPAANRFIEPRIPGLGECQSVPFRNMKDEPVSILPHLYLGSAFHSGCENTLHQLGITAVLNVSKRCPNHFPQSLIYKNIPVDDDTDADLSEWFQEAASFIDTIEAQNGRLLVHCKAGISRSATICMAYLMISRRYRLDEAFEYVHHRRTIISPNLAFMLQLQHLENDLFRKTPTDGVDVIKSDTDFFASRRIVRSVSLPSTCISNIGLSPNGLKKDSLAVSSRNVRDRWSPGFFSPSSFPSFHPIASPS